MSSIKWHASRIRRVLFHPVTVLLLAVGATVLFARILHPRLEIGSLRTLAIYLYHTAIVAPFVAYLLDRLERHEMLCWRQRVVEVFVVVVSVLRAFLPIPLVSGHALFLSYLLWTTPRGVARCLALLMMVDVIYVKLALADVTLVGGVLAGWLAGWCSGGVYLARR